MGSTAIVAGAGFEGRADVVRKYCKNGKEVILIRQPENKHDPNAIAVYVKVPRLFGLFWNSLKQIGYIKVQKAKILAPKMDAGMVITAHVSSFFAPPGREYPRVSLELEY